MTLSSLYIIIILISIALIIGNVIWRYNIDEGF